MKETLSYQCDFCKKTSHNKSVIEQCERNHLQIGISLEFYAVKYSQNLGGKENHYPERVYLYSKAAGVFIVYSYYQVIARNIDKSTLVVMPTSSGTDYEKNMFKDPSNEQEEEEEEEEEEEDYEEDWDDEEEDLI